jgi:hypothetical protein
VTARDDLPKTTGPEPFERAKLPMILAAVGIAGGLAIAGSVEKTMGGVIVLGAWVLGIAALHRLGRAGSVDRMNAPAQVHQAAAAPAPALEASAGEADEDDDDDEDDDEDEPAKDG